LRKYKKRSKNCSRKNPFKKREKKEQDLLDEIKEVI
jgi:hypothetical protein